MTERIERLAELGKHAGTPPHPSASAGGRNAFTRGIDAVILWIRQYAPPVHWLWASLLGLGLFIYAWLVGHTARLVTVGARKWPDIPERCVLAIWHGSAPSLFAAIANWKPRSRVAVMIATEPRGDCLMVLCRLLGVRVIRGDWEHQGWPSIARMAELVAGGGCAIITPDGGGNMHVARTGALVLAAGAMVPLVAVGANCRPALQELHKWDKPRNPVPFGRIAISIEEPLRFEFEDAAAMESARLRLQQALDDANRKVRHALDLAQEK